MRLPHRSVTWLLFSVVIVVPIVLAQCRHVEGRRDAPSAVLLKSNSPEVAAKIAEALSQSDFNPEEYRVRFPAAAGFAEQRVVGALPLEDIVELERTVTRDNRRFGEASGDIIILVKVITKGSIAEELIRTTLQGVDRNLYQLEVVH